jgi:hypothetical protein
LLGDRGCLVWWSEDCIDWKSTNYDLTPRARDLAPVLREMSSPLAQLFLRATRESDPIAIHYSQPSVQADWLLESTVDGPTWLRRFSSFEADHNHMAKTRNGWSKAVQDAGYSPTFVSSTQIEAGALSHLGIKALILPHSLAMSDREIEQMTAFVDGVSPALILCDGIPGLFDQHCKLRDQGPPGLFAKARSGTCSALLPDRAIRQRAGDIADYTVERLRNEGGLDWLHWIKDALQMLPRDAWVNLDFHSRIHGFRLGPARLIAIERNINYQMSEDLKQVGGNQNLEKPIEVEVGLAKAAHAYDLRTSSYLGYVRKIRITLDPWRPSLFALLEVPQSGLIEQLLLSHN